MLNLGYTSFSELDWSLEPISGHEVEV
jgi:hypothetical protein